MRQRIWRIGRPEIEHRSLYSRVAQRCCHNGSRIELGVLVRHLPEHELGHVQATDQTSRVKQLSRIQD